MNAWIGGLEWWFGGFGLLVLGALLNLPTGPSFVRGLKLQRALVTRHKVASHVGGIPPPKFWFPLDVFCGLPLNAPPPIFFGGVPLDTQLVAFGFCLAWKRKLFSRDCRLSP